MKRLVLEMAMVGGPSDGFEIRFAVPALMDDVQRVRSDANPRLTHLYQRYLLDGARSVYRHTGVAVAAERAAR